MTLSADGFARKRLNEIKSDLDTRLTEVLGPIATGPDSVTGELNGVFSDVLDDVWQAAQDTYDAMYPASAEGTSLDGSVSYVGLEREEAAATTVTAMLYGTESTGVAAGSVATASGSQYALDGDVVISRANTGDATISVATIEDDAIYQIIAGGSSVVYTSGTGATASGILNGLKDEFDAEVFNVTVADDTMRIRHADSKTGFALTVSTRLQIDSIGTPGDFTAVEMGAKELPIGALNTIVTITSGWSSVYNLVAGTEGREVETDEQLRARHAESVEVTGTATVKAIRARLLDVTGVTYAAVYENRTGDTDENGLPGHSFESIVYGGAANEIAEKIWENKPAGIETYGSTSVTITDDNGDGQLISFSRPEPQYVWIKVTVNAYDAEEILDPGYVDSIKSAVLSAGQELGAGKDIITQRFYGPIYDATPGLADITVEAAVTDEADGTPVYSEDNIAIGRAQISDFANDRIAVVTP